MTTTLSRRDQRLNSLRRANDVRLKRVALRRQVASGALHVSDVLSSRPDEALNWKIGDLLLAQPRWGANRLRKFLGYQKVSESRTVGQLTDRERERLIRALSGAFAGRCACGRKKNVYATQCRSCFDDPMTRRWPW
jgi:hypothetical protein